MCFLMVDAVGVEPTMPGAADLQSAGVTSFPTHPYYGAYRRFRSSQSHWRVLHLLSASQRPGLEYTLTRRNLPHRLLLLTI